MIFTYTSVNVPMAPPIQIENGAVSRITAPSAMTPASSGVKRVTLCPRRSRPATMARSAATADNSARCRGSRKGI